MPLPLQSYGGSVKMHPCPSAKILSHDDPNGGYANIGVTNRLAGTSYQCRWPMYGGPYNLNVTRRVALLVDGAYISSAPRNHAEGMNTLYSDGSVFFNQTAPTFMLNTSNNWAMLDQD